MPSLHTQLQPQTSCFLEFTGLKPNTLSTITTSPSRNFRSTSRRIRKHQMASKVIEMGLMAMALTMLWMGAAAQLSCTRVIIGMAPCLNYVTGNSSTPSSSCCSQLASVVQSQPQCLCAVLNGGSALPLGISINQTLALALPGACNVKTPPISACNAANGPATSPVSSPTSSDGNTSPAASPMSSSTSSDGTTSPAATPVGSTTSPAESSNENPDSTTTPSVTSNPAGLGKSGSETIPSTGINSSNGGSSITTSSLNHLVLFFLFVASFASTFTSF